jgi:hypothetical protein
MDVKENCRRLAPGGRFVVKVLNNFVFAFPECQCQMFIFVSALAQLGCLQSARRLNVQLVGVWLTLTKGTQKKKKVRR